MQSFRSDKDQQQ